MHGYLSWQDPAALRWLWVAPMLVGLVWYAAARRERGLREFLGRRYRGVEWRWHRRRRWVKGLLVGGAIALLIVAGARPRVGTEMQEVKRVGADVVLVIDTSDSMLAQDVRPSRLEAAKEAALALIGGLESDRIGVVVFAGSAYMYSPLTIDHDAAGMFVASIERGSAPAPGTALHAAIESALRLLQSAEHSHKAIVLFSDGEDHPGMQPGVLSDAREQGVRVHVVGLGGSEGEPIPLPDNEAGDEESETASALERYFGTPSSSGVRSKFKHDKNGEIVLTRINEEMLADIARDGGGVFVKSTSSGANIDRVRHAIAATESGVIGTYEFTQYAERFQWPLGGGVLLLILDALIGPAPRRRLPEGGAS